MEQYPRRQRRTVGLLGWASGLPLAVACASSGGDADPQQSDALITPSPSATTTAPPPVGPGPDAATRGAADASPPLDIANASCKASAACK